MIKQFIIDKFNDLIKLHAEKAVDFAEGFTGENGKSKKEIAISYIWDKLPIPLYLKPFKTLVINTLSPIIDKAIEAAVKKLKLRLKLG